MTRLIVPAVVVVLAVVGVRPAAAQIEIQRYHPLAVGDVRVYIIEASSTTTSGSCPAYESLGHVREEVLRDTTVGGVSFRIVETTRTTAAGERIGASLYAARVLGTGGLEIIPVRDGGGGALVLPDAPSASDTETVPNTVTIGGTAYPVVGTRGFSTTGTGSGGSVQSRAEQFAADIGPLVSRRLDSRSFPPVSCSQSRTLLVYAVVGGATYGVNPVAGEAGPADAVLREVRAYPVPARAAVTVEVGAASRVVVVDVLGRQVAEGAASPGRSLRLDVSGWPAGVYVARTETGVSVRLVVAR